MNPPLPPRESLTAARVLDIRTIAALAYAEGHHDEANAIWDLLVSIQPIRGLPDLGNEHFAADVVDALNAIARRAWE